MEAEPAPEPIPDLTQEEDDMVAKQITRLKSGKEVREYFTAKSSYFDKPHIFTSIEQKIGHKYPLYGLRMDLLRNIEHWKSKLQAANALLKHLDTFLTYDICKMDENDLYSFLYDAKLDEKGNFFSLLQELSSRFTSVVDERDPNMVVFFSKEEYKEIGDAFTKLKETYKKFQPGLKKNIDEFNKYKSPNIWKKLKDNKGLLCQKIEELSRQAIGIKDSYTPVIEMLSKELRKINGQITSGGAKKRRTHKRKHKKKTRRKTIKRKPTKPIPKNPSIQGGSFKRKHLKTKRRNTRRGKVYRGGYLGVSLINKYLDKDIDKVKNLDDIKNDLKNELMKKFSTIYTHVPNKTDPLYNVLVYEPVENAFKQMIKDDKAYKNENELFIGVLKYFKKDLEIKLRNEQKKYTYNMDDKQKIIYDIIDKINEKIKTSSPVFSSPDESMNKITPLPPTLTTLDVKGGSPKGKRKLNIKKRKLR